MSDRDINWARQEFELADKLDEVFDILDERDPAGAAELALWRIDYQYRNGVYHEGTEDETAAIWAIVDRIGGKVYGRDDLFPS